MYSLVGKTAVITGSLSGIGLGMARSLSRVGCNIVLNGFAPKAEINEIVKELTTQRNQVKYIAADLRKPSDAKRLIEQAIGQFGNVDILLNNVGMQHVASIDQLPDQRWEEIVALCLSSAFYTTKAVIGSMQKKGWGRIINTSSIYGLIASQNKSAYTAAKHGIIGLTKVVALQNATKGITCNAICPGWVRTPLIQDQIDKRAKDLKLSEEEACRSMLGDKMPTMKFSRPEEIGELVVFLCSKYADNITGAVYPVDGGWTVQ